MAYPDRRTERPRGAAGRVESSVVLRIRSDQMEALAEAQADRYALETTSWLREERPDLCGERDDPALHALVVEAIESATGFGIELDEDIEAFVEFVLRNGLDFAERDELEWATVILSDDSISGSRKIELLDHYETFGTE